MILTTEMMEHRVMIQSLTELWFMMWGGSAVDPGVVHPFAFEFAVFRSH